MNKKGFIIKWVLIIFVFLVLLMLLAKLAKSESVIDIINITLIINSSNIIVNVSDSIYNLSNVDSLVLIQQNKTLELDINLSNVTIITVTNITLNFSEANITLNCPSEIELSNKTKEEFFNHYITSLGTKIEESSNKVAQDIIFQLAPTKAEIDGCKQAQFNASLKEQEAYRQRDKVAADNFAITSVLENTRNEYKTLQIVALSFVALIVISVSVYLGIWERRGRLW